MAILQRVRFSPWLTTTSGGECLLVPSSGGKTLPRLPQIYWAHGEDWAEVNCWALDLALNPKIDIQTVESLLKHLRAYATFLETSAPIPLDWRHFPMRTDQRVLNLFRGHLMNQLRQGVISSSTASRRIAAVVRFYRYASEMHFISNDNPLWKQESVVIPFFDSTGFKRSMSRSTTDLAIPNRTRHGARLEEGLLPLSCLHMNQVLHFTASEETIELHLMLALGFFTGARLGSITTLQIKHLELARPDPYIPGLFLIQIGPGTGVATKFDVGGDLLVPEQLLKDLKEYAFSIRRLKRQFIASSENRNALFLTIRGQRYSVNTVDRLMTDLRRLALINGITFLERFKFHQTRATFGTWLMKIALCVTTVPAAIEFVKVAMFHKYESTTFKYVKFHEESKAKLEISEEFSKAFSGLGKRDWNAIDA